MLPTNDTKIGGCHPAMQRLAKPQQSSCEIKLVDDAALTAVKAFPNIVRQYSTTPAPVTQFCPISILVDPRDERIRYVLNTSHYKFNNMACNAWIWELHDQGLEPQRYLLERKAPKSRKQHWIAMCREIGCVLFNRRMVEVRV